MTPLRRCLVVCVLWIAFTAVYAFVYVTRTINSPVAAPGYERDWTFQLTMFALGRLPWLLIGVALALAEASRRKPSYVSFLLIVLMVGLIVGIVANC